MLIVTPVLIVWHRAFHSIFFLAWHVIIKESYFNLGGYLNNSTFQQWQCQFQNFCHICWNWNIKNWIALISTKCFSKKENYLQYLTCKINTFRRRSQILQFYVLIKIRKLRHREDVIYLKLHILNVYSESNLKF